jgi:hypothetical protein
MEGAQVLLEVALVLLLAATLFHALRLERALGVLKRDRAVLEDLVAGFNESTRAAEAGIEKLRVATDGAGRQIARQIEQAQRLKDDLGFLTERGDRLAERLEGGVRTARMVADQQAIGPSAAPPARPSPAAPQAPPDVQNSLAHDEPYPHSAQEDAWPPARPAAPGPRAVEPAPVYAAPEPASGPRLRSEAERDLLRALRAAR